MLNLMEKNAYGRQILYSEILPPITENQLILETNERSAFQFLEQFSLMNRNKPKSYRVAKKSHLTMLEKKIHSDLS